MPNMFTYQYWKATTIYRDSTQITKFKENSPAQNKISKLNNKTKEATAICA